MVPFFISDMAEGQGFEPWVGYKPTPVFKTGALNHSATLPLRRKLYIGFSDQQDNLCKKLPITARFLKIQILKKQKPNNMLGFCTNVNNLKIIHYSPQMASALVLQGADHSPGAELGGGCAQHWAVSWCPMHGLVGVPELPSLFGC